MSPEWDLTFQEFTEKYRSLDDSQDAMGSSKLGQGGASSGVERRIARASGRVVAVKALSYLHQIDFPFLLENEVKGLAYANLRNVPRVVRFEELIVLPHGDARVVMELVEGTTLNSPLSELCPSGTADARTIQQHEQQVLEVAVQLIETMHYLHVCNLAHMDVTSSNIMLQQTGYKAWDQLRLLDFGFAQLCRADPRVQDLHPQGATPAFAAPEVLHFLQKQHEGAELNQWGKVPVNGPSSDWWSVGVVLFFLLTGELPFSDEGPIVSKAPLNVPSHCRPQWEDYQCVLEWQEIWIDACDEAYINRVPVKHPLLDKVRQCSTNPDQAASFFLHIFNRVYFKRIAAADHPWIASTISRMYDEMGFNCSSSAAACDSFRVKQSFTRRLCAFLPCFDGRRPTVEADTHPYTWNGDLSRSLVSERVRYLRSSQHKTSCSPAAHTDVPESGLQSADKSALAVAAPAADKDQQVLIRAVTATAVPGSPPELQVAGLAAGTAIYQQLWSTPIKSNERPS